MARVTVIMACLVGLVVAEQVDLLQQEALQLLGKVTLGEIHILLVEPQTLLLEQVVAAQVAPVEMVALALMA